MKKLCLVLALALSMLVGMFACSEGIDISTLSVMELLELRDQIAARLNEILGSPNFCYDDIMVKGVYVCGENILPGTYLFECLDEDKPFQYFVYETKEDLDYGEMMDGYLLNYGEKGSVTLTDGMCIVVGRGYASVKPWSPFWLQ